MLRFAVFDEHGPARDWRLVSAHLLGPDDVSAAGVVSFKGGHILCEPADPNAAHALCLLADAGRGGRLMLPTCLLQQRGEPYHLYEELARHRVKLFLEKSEAWGLLDPVKAPEAFEIFERARSVFVQGMMEEDAAKAELCHRDALALAIHSSEKLATRRAEWMLHSRYGKQGATNALGVRVPVEKQPDHMRSVLHREFDILAVPTPWTQIEANEGRFQWEATDRWMAWAKQNGKRTVGGPLLDLGPSGIPGWARPLLSNPAKLKDKLYEFVRQTVVRYAPMCSIWNIASSVHMNETTTLPLASMVECTRIASVAARSARKDIKLLVEVGDPFNATVTANAGAVSALQYMKAIISDGVNFDLLGIPLLVGEETRGRGTRDIMQLAAVLDRYTARKEVPPVIVTALGAPSASNKETGGWWREPWSQRSQSGFAALAFQTALANPGVAAVVWDRLRDGAGAGLTDAGLFAADGTPKEAAEKLLKLRRRLRSPLGALDGARSAAGSKAMGSSTAGKAASAPEVDRA